MQAFWFLLYDFEKFNHPLDQREFLFDFIDFIN